MHVFLRDAVKLRPELIGGDFVDKLAGDATTDAPPPFVKKKK
jgi:hypothetical protein